MNQQFDTLSGSFWTKQINALDTILRFYKSDQT